MSWKTSAKTFSTELIRPRFEVLFLLCNAVLLVSLFVVGCGLADILTGVLICTALLLYALGAPESRLFGHVLSRLPGGEPLAVLTFDDGPHPEFTPQILDTLKEHGVKAVFFVVGRNAERYPDIVRRIAAEGHQIGNHSATHRRLVWLSSRSLAQEIDVVQRLLEEISGDVPILFRPPKGLRDPRLLQELRVRSLLPVQWSLTTGDWSCPGTEQIIKEVEASLHPGAIILLHDGTESSHCSDRSQTVAALDAIIRNTQKRGYRFSLIPDADL